jgi:pyruvate-formate lyase-activating enzyme
LQQQQPRAFGNMKTPNLVVCDNAGNIFDIPGLLMAAESAGSFIQPGQADLICMPPSSVLYTLPSRIPIGYDSKKKQYVAVSEYNGVPVSAVAAFMPPGYVCTFHSAYEEQPNAPRLPLFCYAAAGWLNGDFIVAAHRIDRERRHEISDEVFNAIDKNAAAVIKRYPRNRLVRHLVNNCVLKYRCPNACNFVLGRWECPVPLSSVCNAACLGCISRQPKSSCVPSTQHRLDFVPLCGEVVEYVVPHLKTASNPIVSFGQGCEGEPLLQASLIEESIRGIRAATDRGIINLNTNGSMPDAVERICKAGLNSMRVSLNSAQPVFYKSYYRPQNYSFDDVIETIMIAVRHKVWVSINYLVFPGFTDQPSEIAALKKLLRKTKLHMIQTRNLNIDPLWLRRSLCLENVHEKPMGIVRWTQEIRTAFPKIRLGYFNPTFRTIRKAT